MDLNSMLAPLRPYLQLAGSILAAAALLKFCGVARIPFSVVDLAVAAWAAKNV